jgi:hypothetical protein
MAGVQLYDYQREAVDRMKTGCILCGGVGSGKSRTALAYYYKENGGKLGTENYCSMKDPPDLYIITTARKRDTQEWEGEMIPFLFSTNPEVGTIYQHKVVVDSWNNIGKYKEVAGAFFIFDEQRVIGNGKWVKAFLKITKSNGWVLLSATPGDTWQDYIPVFIANGFYKNRTQFTEEHVVYSHGSKFPKIDRYLSTGRLMRLRDRILVTMDYRKETVAHHEDIHVDYNVALYKDIGRSRWDPFEKKPIESAAGLCYLWRKVVNSDPSRQDALLALLLDHPKAIIFYNFDYELEILKKLGYAKGTEVAEWNGHKHQPLPSGEAWVYLVQYTAGCEGWNCVSTDTIIFFSQNYSYKVMVQASGRIDRLNTSYTDLFYFHLKSRSGIDLAIARALKDKKNFNEGKYVKWKAM